MKRLIVSLQENRIFRFLVAGGRRFWRMFLVCFCLRNIFGIREFGTVPNSSFAFVEAFFL